MAGNPAAVKAGEARYKVHRARQARLAALRAKHVLDSELTAEELFDRMRRLRSESRIAQAKLGG